MNDDVRARLDSIERRQDLLRQELAGLDGALADLKEILHRAEAPAPFQLPAPFRLPLPFCQFCPP